VLTETRLCCCCCRWGDPSDFAGPVVFLASDASQYVCGELLLVDGVRSPLFAAPSKPPGRVELTPFPARARVQGWMGR
jgi:hypothetical protein